MKDIIIGYGRLVTFSKINSISADTEIDKFKYRRIYFRKKRREYNLTV